MTLFLDTILGESLKRQQTMLKPIRMFIKIGNEPTIRELIIRLNTEGEKTSQLYELGVDSRGVDLEEIGGPYAFFTIEEKKRKGQRFDHITLKDSGEYYDSHEVVATIAGFEMNSDPIKDDTNLFEEWGEDIIGLIPENLQIVINKMIARYQQETLNIIHGIN